MPYQATSSSNLLGLACSVSIRAEELCYPSSKHTEEEEDVSSLDGKDTGASQKQESGQGPGDPEGHRGARTSWDCPIKIPRQFLTTLASCLSTHLTCKWGSGGL